MPLSVGDKLGHYEILSLLGAGGMGEVYRARDTTLKRDVALKVLPATFLRDPERMARFQREAQVLASLDHPNIGHIYGIVDAEDSRGLVLALIEGPTLADRIEAGPLPEDEAIAIAKQIIEALEYAHDRGVVHRDLKPANVKTTPEGVVKVLDFGLAKVLEDEPPASLLTNSPTLTVGHTQAGVILGTAAYMSPEQAVGRPVDRRSDIFSFGAVLYEMLSGRRAFGGATTPDVLEAVVRSEPDWSKLPGDTSDTFQRLLRRCLVKDRKQRLQAIGEARIVLQSFLENPAEEPSSAAPRRSVFMWLWPTVAAILLAALSGVAWRHFHETPPEERLMNSTLLPPEGTSFGGGINAPALSPDGSRIVFPATSSDGKEQLWMRRLDSATAQPLPGTEEGISPFWSPEGRFLGFGDGTKLKKIDVMGGPPVTVAENLPGPLRGASWSPQGVIVFSVNAPGPILRVSATGGAISPATAFEKDKDSSVHRFPWFLPDGRHFLYISSQLGDIPVRVGSLDEPDKAGKVVVQANSPALYSQGHLLYLRQNTLMAQPFDVQRLITTGEAVSIAERVYTVGAPSRLAVLAVSSTGLLAYQSMPTVESRVVWKDRRGKELGTLADPVSGPLEGLELSPDGKSLAVSLSDGSASDVWIYDLARGLRSRFTVDPAIDSDPIWSPDGKMIFWASNRNSAVSNIFRKPANGTGMDELIYADGFYKAPTSVSPEGKMLLYQTHGSGTDGILVVPLAPEQPGAKLEPHRLLESQSSSGQFSGDGKWVAYDSDESGSEEVYAIPFPGPGGRRQISSGGGSSPRWRQDGKELFYLAPGSRLMAAEVSLRTDTLEIGKIQTLFEARRVDSYDVSTDGQKFIVEEIGRVREPPLTLIQNWSSMLKK